MDLLYFQKATAKSQRIARFTVETPLKPTNLAQSVQQHFRNLWTWLLSSKEYPVKRNVSKNTEQSHTRLHHIMHHVLITLY